MFLTIDQLTIDAPDTDKQRLIDGVEAYLCSLLPLEKKTRTISYYPDEVYVLDRWYKFYTSLLNVSSVKYKEQEVERKSSGDVCHELLVALDHHLTFEPYLELQVESGYESDQLPLDIQSLMLELIEHQFGVNKTQALEKSIKMGPREVEYATDVAFKQLALRDAHLKYKLDQLLLRYR